MQCISCGREMAAPTAYCEICGAPQKAQAEPQAEPQAEAQAEAAQEQAQNNNSYYTENKFNSYGSGSNTAYTAPLGGYDPYAPNEHDKPMTVGGWLKTMLIMAIPLVNLVMVFVWAFGDGNTSRKNYFRAYLLLIAISIGLVLLFSIFIGIGASMSGGTTMITNGI